MQTFDITNAKLQTVDPANCGAAVQANSSLFVDKPVRADGSFRRPRHRDAILLPGLGSRTHYSFLTVTTHLPRRLDSIANVSKLNFLV